jgi:signal transduction histidine kinase
MGDRQTSWERGRGALEWLELVLIEPPEWVAASERRTIRLLAAVTLAFMMLIVVGETTWVGVIGRQYFATYSFFQDALFVVGVTALALTAIAYALSRTRYHHVSSWLLITISIAAPWLCALLLPESYLFSWAFYQAMGLVIASMFLDVRGMALLIVLTIMSQLALLVLRPLRDYDELIPIIIALGCIGTLMILAQRHKALVEQDRRRELIQANESLARTNRELEKSIAEAQQARAIAEEANRLKGEFLAITSHELKTPLNSTMGFTACLLNGIGVTGPTLSVDQTQLLRKVESSSKQLLAKINDLLDMSRLQADRVEVSIEPLSPGALLEQALTEFDHYASVKGVALRGSLSPMMPDSILGDVVLLNRVLHNLLSNALKFTHQGKIEVDIKPVESDRWQVSVSDTGIGIAPEHLGLIFEPFRQVDSSFERSYEGTGLGLTVARGSVRLMEGSIEVQSTPGVGSTFTVTLPLIKPADHVAAPKR